MDGVAERAEADWWRSYKRAWIRVQSRLTDFSGTSPISDCIEVKLRYPGDEKLFECLGMKFEHVGGVERNRAKPHQRRHI